MVLSRISRILWIGCFKLTRTALTDITFVRGDVRPVHGAMVEAAEGKNVWLTGGGEFVGAFADHGLLDEIILGLAPVMLGGGAPLLPRRLLSPHLSLVNVDRAGQFVYLTYVVRR